MRILITGLFALLLCGGGFAAEAGKVNYETIAPQQFLAAIRRPMAVSSWVQLAGTIYHKRESGAREEGDIYVGVLFTPGRIVGQVVIDNSQGYTVGHSYKGSDAVVMPMKKGGYKTSLLSQFGVKPEDLTLNFIYWDFIKELEPESIRLNKCRVFILSDPNSVARAKVYFSCAALFPMRVEWLKPNSEKVHRKLEMNSFRKDKKSGVYLITGITLYGGSDQWRTLISFSKTAAGDRQDQPKDLFRKIEKHKK